MKKILAFFLVACLAATAAFCAFSVSAESTNLAKGKTVTKLVSAHNTVKNYDADLTDGEIATTMGYAAEVGEWFSFYYNPDNLNEDPNDDRGYHNVVLDEAGNRIGTIVVDLAAVSTIESVKIHYNKDYLPQKMEIQVSNDGSSYSSLTKKDVAATDEVDGFGMWADYAFDAGTGRYVKFIFSFTGMFAMLDEIEIYGTEGAGAPEESKVEAVTSSEAAASSEPEAEPVKEEITVDGKLDDTGWVMADFKKVTPDNGKVQSGSDLGKFEYSYALRADDKNVYVAIKTNAGVKNVDTSLDGFDAIRVTGTGIRMYIEVDNATKKFDRLVDVLVEDGKAVGYLGKEVTDAYTVAMVTGDKETVFEFALSIEKMGIGDSFKMAVSYCDVFGETFDVLNDHMYTSTDNSDAPWAVDTHYTTYKLADLAMDEYVPGTDKPAETTSSEAPAATSSKAPATSTGKPATGDEGVIVFALLAMVAIAGAVVAVRKRG